LGREVATAVAVCVRNEDAPVISCLQSDYLVSVGDRARLSCSVSANPGSVLTWMHSVGGKLTEHINDPTINESIKVCHVVAAASRSLARRRIRYTSYRICNFHV